jgi:hypothetical protein
MADRERVSQRVHRGYGDGKYRPLLRHELAEEPGE